MLFTKEVTKGEQVIEIKRDGREGGGEKVAVEGKGRGREETGDKKEDARYYYVYINLLQCGQVSHFVYATVALYKVVASPCPV